MDKVENSVVNFPRIAKNEEEEEEEEKEETKQNDKCYR